MQNEEITKLIDNLKGRRKYEEKKATKLGFNSLYDYFKDKISKQKKIMLMQEKVLKTTKEQSKLSKKEKNKKNTCGCC